MELKKLFLAYVNPGDAAGFTKKKFSPFGPAGRPAIGNFFITAGILAKILIDYQSQVNGGSDYDY